MALTPLALQNEALLRHIAGQPTDEPFASFTAIADALGKDRSNLTKTLNLLALDEVITMRGDNRLLISLTDAGREQLAAIDRANNPLAMLLNAEDARDGDEEVPPSMVFPDPDQPRKAFDEAEIDELAEAIATSGWVAPLLVRPYQNIPWAPGETGYPLTAGERRWRAVSRLIERQDPRWPKGRGIPIQIRDTDPKQTAIIALMENIHRSSLKPLEEAAGFHRLHTEFDVPTDSIAEAAGVSRRTVQQRLQLLDLSDDHKADLNAGRITVEQARKLVQDRPPPIAVTPAQLMLLAEIAHHVSPRGQPVAWRPATVNWTARADDLFEEVRKMGLAGFMSDWSTKLWQTQLTDAGVRALADHVPDFATDRDAALSRLRQAGVSAKALGAWSGAGFVTAWLNAPYEMSPDDKQEVERRRQEAINADKARDAREEEAVRLRQQGRDMLLAVRRFEAIANDLPVPEFVSQFGALWSTLGFKGPFRTHKPTDVHDADAYLVDGEDRSLLAPRGEGIEALRRFYALAFNFASGFPPRCGPAPTPEQLEDLAGWDLEAEEEDDDAEPDQRAPLATDDAEGGE